MALSNNIGAGRDARVTGGGDRRQRSGDGVGVCDTWGTLGE